MADDYRVTVTFDDPGPVGRLTDRLRAHRVEDEARDRLGGRISISGSGSQVFLYSDSAAAAQEAETTVRAIIDAGGVQADFALDRWHPIEERWEDGAKSLPESAAEIDAEHQTREAEEEVESLDSGYAGWEVRVETAGHREAMALAERLTSEGYDPIRRWTYLIVGANTEDQAHTLAQSIQAEAADANVTVEPAPGMIHGVAQGSPFAIFG